MYEYCSMPYDDDLEITNSNFQINGIQEAVAANEEEGYFAFNPSHIKVPEFADTYNSHHLIAAASGIPVPTTFMSPSSVQLSSSPSLDHNLSSMPSIFTKYTSLQSVYADIFAFTSNESYNLDLVRGDASTADDPLNDPHFMAFLASLPSSSNGRCTKPTNAPDTILNTSSQLPNQQTRLLLQQLQQEQYDCDQLQITPLNKPTTAHNSTVSKKKRLMKRKSNNNSDKPSSSKLGQCQHPKHVFYRQEKHTFVANPTDSMMMKTIPRRGRPPKGAKLMSELLANTVNVRESPTLPPVIAQATPLSSSLTDTGPSSVATMYHTYYHYPIVELTVRPLPKRLEAVVGRSNIKVCLTCLKRSDMDPEYLRSSLYVGPQQQHNCNGGGELEKQKRTRT